MTGSASILIRLPCPVQISLQQYSPHILKGMLYKATPLGFTYNLIQLAYSFVLATIREETLYVYQASNSIGPRIRIFELILEPHSRICYIDDLEPYSAEYTYDDKRDAALIKATLSKDKIRALICECLTFKDLFTDLDGADWSAAVHCRGGDKVAWGEMEPIPIGNYVAALGDLPPESRVFLMTDTGATVRQFSEAAAAAGKKWNITTFVSETTPAYNQYSFNDKTAREKIADLKQLVREILIARQAPLFVGTASSNVSLLIFLTRSAGATGAVSLDVPADIFFNGEG